MLNADYIWHDPDGVWFKVRSPRGYIHLMGPFTDNAEGEEGANVAINALAAEGWTKLKEGE